MLKLVAFTEDDIDVLIDWVPSAEFNHLWSGDRFNYPLDTKQLAAHLQTEEVTALMLCHGNQRVGYIELFRESETTYRLCRVLIGEAAIRGMGYGQKMVELAIEHARKQFHAERAKLTVFEHNHHARGCYESLGFVTDKRRSGFHAANGQIWSALYMSKAI
ncbi:GNAT family N-acetyltransferase [Photobacterium gaetbulicola]|uniref:Putative acetyltransferase n=1 Tax=Photobacterium gaetbulicola Gung47 TaxID=658445 RepID=A0A0C5WEJ6_9GAMM|nr:GNAT family N-acetyltransferase [Photobacterium gaetbulicola]AJR05543.1 putative acetyltransferase [Photobacterium gaetbulicola Gung47]PSU14530.1 GNAT family N-acetyltransferase [Photobacterium gaetbulicola]